LPTSAPILIFDSGLGGLTVHDQLRLLMPGAQLAYIADDAGFPYGDLPESVCLQRVEQVIARAISSLAPRLVVIACNTASTIALSSLRQNHELPFVGTVPAVKPAAAASSSGQIAVLGTPATINREYTHSLISAHAANCKVMLVGAPRLAQLAEAYLTDGQVDEEAVRAEITPCFVKDAAGRTDAVALACTHYPLLHPVFQRVAPWPVHWIDPAPAVAKRVLSLLGPMAEPVKRAKTTPLYLTTGRKPPEGLEKALRGRGLVCASGLALPLDRPATG
jgi:glutamate racemase